MSLPEGTIRSSSSWTRGRYALRLRSRRTMGRQPDACGKRRARNLVQMLMTIDLLGRWVDVWGRAVYVSPSFGSKEGTRGPAVAFWWAGGFAPLLPAARGDPSEGVGRFRSLVRSTVGARTGGESTVGARRNRTQKKSQNVRTSRVESGVLKIQPRSIAAITKTVAHSEFV